MGPQVALLGHCAGNVDNVVASGLVAGRCVAGAGEWWWRLVEIGTGYDLVYVWILIADIGVLDMF